MEIASTKLLDGNNGFNFRTADIGMAKVGTHAKLASPLKS